MKPAWSVQILIISVLCVLLGMTKRVGTTMKNHKPLPGTPVIYSMAKDYRNAAIDPILSQSGAVSVQNGYVMDVIQLNEFRASEQKSRIQMLNYQISLFFSGR